MSMIKMFPDIPSCTGKNSAEWGQCVSHLEQQQKEVKTSLFSNAGELSSVGADITAKRKEIESASGGQDQACRDEQIADDDLCEALKKMDDELKSLEAREKNLQQEEKKLKNDDENLNKEIKNAKLEQQKQAKLEEEQKKAEEQQKAKEKQLPQSRGLYAGIQGAEIDYSSLDISTLQMMNEEKTKQKKQIQDSFNYKTERKQLIEDFKELSNKCRQIDKGNPNFSKCLKAADKYLSNGNQSLEWKQIIVNGQIADVETSQRPILHYLDSMEFEQEKSENAKKGLQMKEKMDDLMEKESSLSSMNCTFPGRTEEPTADELSGLINESEKYKDKLDAEELKKYEEFLSQVKKNPDGSIDIDDVDTRKSFLYFNKLVRSEGNIPKIRGFDENSKILGKYSVQNRELVKMFKNPPTESFRAGIANFSLKLHTDHSVMITSEIINKTKDRQDEMLREFIKKHDISDEEFANVRVGKTSEKSHMKICGDGGDEYTYWKRDVVIDSTEESSDAKVTDIVHELYHVMQSTPASQSKSEDVDELCASLDTLIRNDELYKLANGISLSEVVNYDKPIKISIRKNDEEVEHVEINLGQIANTFREIMKKYNFQTYEEAVMSPEGRAFIEKPFEKLNHMSSSEASYTVK
ncbi:hypothetical protein IJG72_03780 [bacterium]|nr:hypothetical protein [bacterium]